MPTIFERIVAGEIPSKKIWEDDNHLAFLDIRPVSVGHTLVIPKQATDYLFDLPEEEYAALMNAARQVSIKLKQRLDCKRVVMMVYGYEVPHAHVHLVPTNAISDVSFPEPNQQAIDQLDQTFEKLRAE